MEGQDPRELYATIAENLKMLRSERGLLQKDVAQYLGVSQQTYATYESSKYRITLETLSKLAAFYNVSMVSILTKSNEADDWLNKLASKNFTEAEKSEITAFADYIDYRSKS